MTARPGLHHTPRSGWINDPLGLTWHDGRYHLFFQYVPGRTAWAPQASWGHAVSDDGLVWTERPVALEPGDGDGGCWSGSLVVSGDGRPARIFYTAVDAEDYAVGRVRVADATDDSWDAWDKGAVVARIPEGYRAVAFRDPFVFRDGDRWRMLLGAGRPDGTAVALAYSSVDLDTWEHDGEFASRGGELTEPVWTGEVWECPQFLRIGDKHVLIFAVWRPVETFYQGYAIGTYRDGVFAPEVWGRLTYGRGYYAGSVFHDAAGAPGIVYWLPGPGGEEAGWASATSVPHLLELRGDRLEARATPAVAARRGRPVTPVDGTLGVPDPADLVWDVAAAPRGSTLTIRSAGAQVLELTVGDGTVAVAGEGPDRVVPCGDTVRVLLDGAVVEVFAAGGVFAAPAATAGGGFEIAVSGGAVTAYPLSVT